MIGITCARKAILALALVALVTTAAPAPQGVAAPPPPAVPAGAAPADAMPIEVRLRTFEILNADEGGGNGDEPYLFVVVVYADGTTIDVSNLANARVRLWSPARTHGNLGLNHVGASNDIHPIPEATGRHGALIQPIRGLAVDLAKQLSEVAVLVIAMEEDGTSRRAANAARQALIDNLQRELDAAVQAMQAPDIGQLTNRIRARMTAAATKATLDRWWAPFEFLAGVGDLDDFIDAEVRRYSYSQIESAERPFIMNFSKRGVHYRLAGVVRRLL